MARPNVVVYSLASADGRLTISPDTLLLFGDPRWEAVAGSSMDVYKRVKAEFQPQAILEGSGSMVLEGTESEPLPPIEGDPAPLYDDFLPEVILNRPGHKGWLTITDSRGRVRWLYKEFPDPEWEGWYLMILVSRQTPPEYLAYLRRENIPYLVAGEHQRVDLACALEKMAALLGIQTVLSTAGGKLNGALLRAGLVDEINIEFFPAIIGGPDTPSLFDAPALKPGEMPTRLKLLSAETQGEGRVWLRYMVLPG